MPRVRQPQRTVFSSPLPTPGAGPRTDFSGQAALAQGVERATDVAIRLQQKAREDALAVRVEELEGEFTGLVNTGLHDRNAGILNQAGKAAAEQSEGWYDWLGKQQERVLEQVDDERARDILRARTAKLVESARSRVEVHVAAQNEKADDDALTALRARVKDRLGVDALDRAARAAAVEQLVPHLQSYARRKGFTPEAATALEAAWRGEAAELVMNRLVSSGRYAQARSYLADPAVQAVLGDRIPRFEAALVQDEQEADGAARGRAFVAGATNREGRFDLPAAQAQLDALLADPGLDPRIKKAAEAEFSAASTRAARAWDAKLDETVDRALTKIQNGGLSLAAAADERRWLLSQDVNGGKLWAAIEQHRRGILRERSQGLPETPEQQAAMVDYLVALPGNLQRYAARPEEFRRDWLGRLSPKDLERAAGYVAMQGVAARKPDESLPPSFVADVVALGAQAGKWKRKGPTTPEQKALFYQLERELLSKQGELRAAGGGSVDQAKLRAYAEERLAAGRVLEGGDGATAIEAESQPGNIGKTFVSEKDETRIREQLVRLGYPSTDEWIRWALQGERGVPDAQNPMPTPPAPLDDAARRRRGDRTSVTGSGGF